MHRHYAVPATAVRGDVEMHNDLEFETREGISLFKHQAQMGDTFLEKMKAHSGEGTFFSVIPPNGGKTLASSYCMLLAKKYLDVKNLIVLAPNVLIRGGWPEEALHFGLHLSKEITAKKIAQRKIDNLLDGFCITYQTVASFPEVYRGWVNTEKTCVVFDEIHHLGTNQTWGQACRYAFEHAEVKICLSGTPFRSDRAEISFLEYEECI